MFFQMLQGCWDSGFRLIDRPSLPEAELPAPGEGASIDDREPLVVVQTRGPGKRECFILQQRDCYWSMLGSSHLVS